MARKYAIESVSLLKQILGWIKENVNIDDIYDEETIIDWVRNKRNPEDVYNNLIDSISKNYEPEQVFLYWQLEKWSEDNGFKKEWI